MNKKTQKPRAFLGIKRMAVLAIWLLASKRSALAFSSNIYHHSISQPNSRCFSSLAFRTSICLVGSSQEVDNKFVITAPYAPTADQPKAINNLVNNVQSGDRYSILRGCTGTGKTLVMAHCIAKLGKPTLVLCHNKTLAAQLARELRACLKQNHVQLFVSYYNHYVPESYSETTGKYVSKKSSVNDELDALRHMATRALVQHRDVVVVASVSCIYGLGMPKSYLDACFTWSVGGSTQFSDLQEIIEALEQNLYQNTLDNHERDDNGSGDLSRGQYELTSTGTTTASISLWQPSDLYPMRVDLKKHESNMWTINNIALGHNKGMKNVPVTTIFPAKHHVSDSNVIFEEALRRIEDECSEYSDELLKEGKIIEANRLQKRVSQDLILLKETGTCPGVENYSRHFNLREEGDPPDTLLDYFGLGGDGQRDWLLMVDESHVTLSQLKAMHGGDRARKRRLVKYGYRLPSALDNRPLRDDEFWDRVQQTVFVSATPNSAELTLARNPPVDMTIRPTYVCDPIIETRPIRNQLDDLVKEVLIRAERNERTLALSLTKRDAEDLSSYLAKHGVRSDYIHSGLNTHQRSNVLKALQIGSIDCLVGVNVLREGLDLPQVSLVAILNADVEGFLRSQTALLQMIGRAARNMNGMAILYADRITNSMKSCIDATTHRRKVQLDYNSRHGKEMRSTKGSSIQSIFEILKDQIQAEQQPLEIAINSDKNHETFNGELESTISIPVHQNSSGNSTILTDHIPSKPGVYFWKDRNDSILYIGKAKRLRSRVKSYLAPNAKHSLRIKTMLEKASQVEFLLTPSDRDALILESNLIKHHQPPYNVLLKDDESYPYICASIGDSLPSFSMVPRKVEGVKAANYMYFGPYPHYNELSKIMEEIERKYELRSKSFEARFGTFSKVNYNRLFCKVLDEVFLSTSESEELVALRSEYEEGSHLFDSNQNQSRDVVAVEKINSEKAVVHLVQLREGLVAGQFSYTSELTSGIDNEEDFGALIQTVLERRHYPQGEATPNGQFSFFPHEILVQYPVPDSKTLKEVYRAACLKAEPTRIIRNFMIRKPVQRGQRKKTDARAMQFAKENAAQVVLQKSRSDTKENSVTITSVDGTAIKELKGLLALEKEPFRIECYDISHTQGDEAVGSRVVFVSGKPKKDLYRKFNVKTVEGVDDYASIEEVLERRFRKAWINGVGGLVDQDDPWSIPDLVVIDGGKGQLGAALKGMAKANIFASNRQIELFQNSGDDIQEENVEINTKLLSRYARVPVVSLAKKEELVYVPDISEPINNSTDSAALLLLRSLRDESHRFALAAHRRRRSDVNGWKP